MTDKMLDLDLDRSIPLVAVRIKGDRRFGGDRRAFSYSLHIPERRTGKDRRSGRDRRKLSRIKNR